MDLLKQSPNQEAELLPFAGYCRVFVVDSDGLQRKTKGSRIEAPLHLSTKAGDTRVFTAYFPAKDPVSMLKIQCDQQEYVYAKMWAGGLCKPDENPNTNFLFCVVEGQNCKKLLDEVEASSDRTCRCQAFLPFLPNCYASPLVARLFVTEEKFVYKVTRLEVELSENQYQQWLQYFRTLRCLEKDADDEKKHTSDKKK